MIQPCLRDDILFAPCTLLLTLSVWPAHAQEGTVAPQVSSPTRASSNSPAASPPVQSPAPKQLPKPPPEPSVQVVFKRSGQVVDVKVRGKWNFFEVAPGARALCADFD
ncbi:MAG: hypothetical protein ACK5P7_08970 [Bdellovibrio sp.]